MENPEIQKDVEKEPTIRPICIVYDEIDNTKTHFTIKRNIEYRRMNISESIKRFLGVLPNRADVYFSKEKPITSQQQKNLKLFPGYTHFIAVVKREYSQKVDPRTSLELRTTKFTDNNIEYFLPDVVQPIQTEELIERFNNFNIFWGSTYGFSKKTNIGALATLHYCDKKSEGLFPHMLRKEQNVLYVLQPFQVRDEFINEKIHPYVKENFGLIAHYEEITSGKNPSYDIVIDTPQSYEEKYFQTA